MAQPIARLGDTSSHGGQIISASGNVFCDGAQVARHGDILQCPAHGAQPINSISGGVSVNGRRILTVGAVANCGATITTGSARSRSG